MRILTLTNCPLDPLLGSGRTVLRYSAGLRALGHTVDVLEPLDYQWWPRMRRGKRFTQAFGAATSVIGRLRDNDYDIVELYGAEYWLVTALTARWARRPFIVAHTNGLELLHIDMQRATSASMRQRVSQAIHYKLMWSFFAGANGFVSLCEADREYVVDRGLFPASGTAVIEPGLDEEFLENPALDLDGREPRICFTGSWIPRKGLRALAAVIPAVLRLRPRVQFDVFGTSTDPSVIMAAFPSDVRSRIVVHPRLSNRELAAALRLGTIFFFPSEYEGYGMALAEAMACGLASVTTPTGLGRSLRDGHDALICGYTDNDKMIAALLTLIDHDGLRVPIAQNGWERVRRLSWRDVSGDLAACYERWIAEPS